MAQTPEYRRLVRLAAGYNRKARLYGARGTITAATLQYIAQTNQTCAYCGIWLEDGQGSFDHAVALNNLGRNDETNVVRCCLTCQRQKFTKTPAEYAAHQELRVQCAVCGTEFQPRWAEYRRGAATVCSRSCAARKRWMK